MVERLLTREEVAKRLGVSERTVHQLVVDGLLARVRPTGRRAVRFSSVEVQRLIQTGRQVADRQSGP